MRGPIVPKAVPLPVLSVAVIPIVRCLGGDREGASCRLDSGYRAAGSGVRVQAGLVVGELVAMPRVGQAVGVRGELGEYEGMVCRAAGCGGSDRTIATAGSHVRRQDAPGRRLPHVIEPER